MPFEFEKEEIIWELGRIKINILKRNGKKYIDIRKYYKDGNKFKPTRKGIMMNIDDWRELFLNIDMITEKFEKFE